MRAVGSDFAAFPRRRSTWVLLGIGGAAAAIAYPFDTEVNQELQESDTLGKVMKPGKYLGNGWVQAGAAVGLEPVGRFRAAPGPGGTRNKVAHMGLDLLWANILTQTLTGGIKIAVRRDRPTGECCSFPSGHASVTFAAAAVIERHFGYRASWPMFAIAGYTAASRPDRESALPERRAVRLGTGHGQRLDRGRPTRSWRLRTVPGADPGRRCFVGDLVTGRLLGAGRKELRQQLVERLRQSRT